VIDISRLMLPKVPGDGAAASGSAQVLTAISDAVTIHGIFAITGHGIPLDVMATALAAAKGSLRSGGAAEKERWHEHEQTVSSRQPGEVGNFQPTGMENVGRAYGNANAPPETIQKFTVWPPRWNEDPAVPARQRNIWPATANGEVLRDALESFYSEMQRVSEVVHSGLAQCMGKPASFIQDTLAPYEDGVLRGHYYFPHEGTMFAHKDWSTTTLLLSDAPGLQFQPRDSDAWVDVVVPAGALICNLGEFFEVWTHGAWRATPHRVVAAGKDGRTSIAFFANQGIPKPLDGSDPEDRIIAPLDGALLGAPGTGGQLEWTGLETGIGSDAQKSIGYPSFLLNRLRKMSAAGKGGA
jgi:isopenicillin N synthase-like dioxygenase